MNERSFVGSGENIPMKNRKDIIIDSAKSLFAEKGYSATGLREIADRAGVSIGNIYNYFKNKKEIFEEILSPDMFIETLSNIPNLINEDFPFNLDKIILTSKRAVDRDIELYTLIFIDLIEFNGYSTNKIIDTIIKFGQSVFEDKIKNDYVGPVLKNLDYDFFVKSFIVMSLSFFITTNILPSAKMESYSDEQVSSMISDLILKGITV